jgi:hypothetical protein
LTFSVLSYIQFDPWPLTTKPIRIINSLRGTVYKSDVCQGTGSQVIERSVYSYVLFNPLTFDLNINIGHLLFMMY